MPSAPSDSGDSEYSEGRHSHTGSEYDSDSGSGTDSDNSNRDQSESEESIPSTKQSADNETIFYEDLMSSSESEGSERESGSHEALAAVQETSAQPHKGRKKSAKSTAGTVQPVTAGTEKIVHYSLDNADSLEKVIAELRERQQLLQTLAGANAPSQPPTASTKSSAAKKAVKPAVASAPAPKATSTPAPRGISKIRRDQLKRLAGLKKILDKAVTSYNDLAASIEQTE